MSAKITHIDHGRQLLQPTWDNKSCSASEQVNQSSLVCEPELQHLRRTAEASSSTIAICQLFLAVFFLAAALVEITLSFAELTRLLERDAIQHVTERVISQSSVESGSNQVTAPAAVPGRGPRQAAVWSRTISFPETSPGHVAAEEFQRARG
jgi:hypothetical protein